MAVKLLTKHHLEFLNLKGGCRGSSESTLVKMPHCWKSHVMAQMMCFCVQGPRAEAMMRSAMERGKWVFFQNCHLAPSFMPMLERLIEQIDPDKVRKLSLFI